MRVIGVFLLAVLVLAAVGSGVRMVWNHYFPHAPILEGATPWLKTRQGQGLVLLVMAGFAVLVVDRLSSEMQTPDNLDRPPPPPQWSRP